MMSRCLLPLLALACAVIPACVDAVEPWQPPRSDGAMSASLNDSLWQASRTNVTYVGKKLTVTGRSGSEEVIVDFMIDGVDGPGIYNIGEIVTAKWVNAGHVRKWGFEYYTPVAVPPKLTGSVTIDRLNDSISGGFRFIVRRNADIGSPDSVDVREGRFIVKRPE